MLSARRIHISPGYNFQAISLQERKSLKLKEKTKRFNLYVTQNMVKLGEKTLIYAGALFCFPPLPKCLKVNFPKYFSVIKSKTFLHNGKIFA